MPYGKSGKNFTGKAKTITGKKNYGTGRANPRRVNRTRNRSARSNLTARPGQYINERTGRPYTGPIHMHSGRAMIGATHSSTPHDYLRKTGRNRRRMINNSGNGNLYNYGHVECDCAGSGGLISIDTTSQTHHNHVSRICRGDCGYANETVYGGGGTGNQPMGDHLSDCLNACPRYEGRRACLLGCAQKYGNPDQPLF